MAYRVGDQCQCVWEDNNWYQVTVMDVDVSDGEAVYKVHYDGSEYDEFVYESSLMPLHEAAPFPEQKELAHVSLACEKLGCAVCCVGVCIA